MSLDEKLDRVLTRAQELGARLSSPDGFSSDEFRRLSMEFAELAPVVETVEALRRTRAELADARALAAESDGEMRALAEEEAEAIEARLPDLERQVMLQLLPRDEADSRNAILEVRAGTGGDEAALFAAELFAMYQRYAQLHGWRFEVMEVSENEIGGYKEAIATISGNSVFAHMKFESGVHRVQRVPVTESQGRIHTSSATVIVLPEADEVDVQIDDSDLQVDVYRSSGPGGQSVNTTDSAVRVTHLPTGMVVAMQDEKSQLQNKVKAMRVLRSRLLRIEQDRQREEASVARKDQVGGGGRSEKIRTYNFKENRVTDHRIGLTLYRLDRILAGDLDEVTDGLLADERTRQLADG